MEMGNRAEMRVAAGRIVTMSKQQCDALKNTREMLKGNGGGTVDRGSVLDNLEWSLTLARRVLDYAQQIEGGIMVISDQEGG